MSPSQQGIRLSSATPPERLRRQVVHQDAHDGHLPKNDLVFWRQGIDGKPPEIERLSTRVDLSGDICHVSERNGMLARVVSLSNARRGEVLSGMKRRFHVRNRPGSSWSKSIGEVTLERVPERLFILNTPSDESPSDPTAPLSLSQDKSHFDDSGRTPKRQYVYTCDRNGSLQQGIHRPGQVLHRTGFFQLRCKSNRCKCSSPMRPATKMAKSRNPKAAKAKTQTFGERCLASFQRGKARHGCEPPRY